MAIQGRSYLRLANVRAAAAATSSGVTGTAAQSTAAVTQAASGSSTVPDFTGTAAQTLPHATQTAVHASARFVTAVSANGRYFVDSVGDPILIRGHTAWSGIADWSSSQADTFFDHMVTRGMNAVIMEVISSTGDGGGPNANGATYDGIAPFTSGVTFNSSYWSRVDSYLNKAKDRGITVFLYAMDGWNTLSGGSFSGVSNANCQTYGNTLATRYLSQPNIVWCFGGDYTPDGGTIDGQFNACLTGIRAAGDNRPASIQLSYYKSLSTDSSYWESRVQYNWVYTYYPQYKAISDGYNRSPGARDPRPALWMEGRYEGEGGGSGEPTQTDETLRVQECWALTSGSPGTFYGNDDWEFLSGWESRVDSTAQQQLQKIRDLFDDLAWHELIPDDATGQSAVITAGRGTKVTTDTQTWPLDNDYVTASRNSTKTLMVAYVPSNSGNTARTVTLDPAQIPAVNRTALWVDPTDATSTQTATINGSNQTTTPGTHGDGTRDWLLVITGDTFTGTAANTAPHIGQTASGTVAAPGFTGTAAQTLPHIGQAASGTTVPPDFTGTAAQTLAAVTQAASGTTVPPNFTGTSAQTLPHVTMAASGTVVPPDFAGTATQTLAAVTQSASGTSSVPNFTGTAASTLAAVTQSAAGTVDNPPGAAGTVDQTLPHVTQSSSGTTVPPAYTGTVIQTLPPITQSGTGVAEGPVTGTAAQSLPAVGQAASGTVDNPPGFTGTAAQALAPITQSGAGTFTPPAITGTAATTAPPVGQAATGGVVAIYTGTVIQTLPAVTQLAFTVPPPVVRNAVARIRSNDSTARIR